MPRPDVFLDQQSESAVRQAGAAGLDVTQLFESTRSAASIIEGALTAGTRAQRLAAVGMQAGDRWIETDTAWEYRHTGLAWAYNLGIYFGADAQRGSITPTSADEGAPFFATDTGRLWRVVSAAWAEHDITAKRLRETGGPTVLAMGAVADGQFLKRAGSSVVGAAAGTGDVSGPGSAVSGNVAIFNGTTGKIIQDGGKGLPAGAIVGDTDSQALTNKTLQTTGGGLDIKLGGSTSSFPAIKRNTTIIQFRLADDSAFCVADGTYRGFYSATFTFSFGALNAAGTAYRVIVNKSDAAHIQTHSTGQYSWGSTTGTQNSESPDTGLARAAAATVKPTNGSSGYGKFEMASGVTWQSGSGSPEGVVTASVGSLYTRTDGGATTTLYVKESGSGNVGWIAK